MRNVTFVVLKNIKINITPTSAEMKVHRINFSSSTIIKTQSILIYMGSLYIAHESLS